MNDCTRCRLGACYCGVPLHFERELARGFPLYLGFALRRMRDRYTLDYQISEGVDSRVADAKRELVEDLARELGIVLGVPK